MSAKRFRMEPSRLSAALVAALVMPLAGTAFAQDATTTDQATTTEKKAETLDKVIVTGSLIPQTSLETAKPVLVISAEDLKTRGYTNVQDALHQSSFSTGAVQGNQTSASFTQGAETNSLFGLNPGYTKYLIDGRPMANYPALYNGTDVFNNISGIPIDLVERIEILPGGQSSLYGSDALAGVVNIILKKNMDGSVVSARIGDYDEGGGESRRISAATDFGSDDGRFHMLLGGQFEHTDPIWGYQRDLTKQYNTEGYSAPVSGRDVLVYAPYNPASTSYYFLDPNDCAGVSSGFGGTEGVQYRPGRNEPYCGSLFSPGYRTIKNGGESTQVYTHATFDVNDNLQLYGDLLYSQESTRYHVGSGFTWWGSSSEFSSTSGVYFDPNLGNFMALQRGFMPEDMGGYERSMSRDDSSSYALTLGANGTFGGSNWDYDVGFTRTEYKLTENQWARLKDPINNWFNSHILGPQQGTYYGYPVFTPDYAAFYQLLTPADMNSFTDYTHSHSKTYDNMLRAQVTNSSLFSLPGGDAGIALAVETGTQGWTYSPDARLVPDPVTLESEIWGTTAISGNGSRSRYAVLGELRLPVFSMLTANLSARYDSYKVSGEKVSKPTYNVGLEFRPIESLLFRGQYGTAFKVPTLGDQFQGLSGFYSSTNDYLYCHSQNPAYGVDNFDDCTSDPTLLPQNTQPQYFGTTSGNPELEPITAKVWSYGVVWAPTAKFSIALDYHHWNIENEVAQQSVDQIMRDDLNCTSVADGGTGTLDPNSGTCQAVFNQVVRNGAGALQSIYVGKINVAREELNALTLDVNYDQSIGNAGDLSFKTSWTKNLKHEQQTYPTDPVIDLLNSGYNNRDPIWRGNASLGWSKGDWVTTLYANIIGPTPNYTSWTTSACQTSRCEESGSYTTFNASVNWQATSDLGLSFIVTNLANKMPDMDVQNYPGTSGAPFNDAFDPYGRAYYLEARWNFGKKD
ncbi:TonB-dependent receptor plug domain-containing protein [Pseudoluteimonas lycopersici]|nr:TonB-dependent receptor [Lysobacter lycopersici]